MDFEKDRAFIEAAVPDLQEYILSSQLYWPVNLKIPGRPQESASLTPGNLLLSIKRLSNAAISPPLDGDLENLVNIYTAFRERWLSNWRAKAKKEFDERFRQWERYIEIPNQGSEKRQQDYRYEVRSRVVLQLLLEELGETAKPAMEKLDHLDQVLRTLTKTGPYLWEAGTEGVFPGKIFWYLYVIFHQDHEKTGL